MKFSQSRWPSSALQFCRALYKDCSMSGCNGKKKQNKTEFSAQRAKQRTSKEGQAPSVISIKERGGKKKERENIINTKKLKTENTRKKKKRNQF